MSLMWILALLLVKMLYCLVLVLAIHPCITFGTSCDEFLSLPCCSHDEAYTSSSACVETNHVEEIKELKAQVTSLKKDLEKCHEGKATLNNILCVQKSPNDKAGLRFNSNKKKKSKRIKKKETQRLSC